MRKSKRIKWIFVAALLPFCLLFQNCNSSNDNSPASPTKSSTAKTEKMHFTGVGEFGIFDASMEKDPSSSTIWMSFSAVDPSVQWPTENPHTISTHLAHSNDAGKTWIYDKKLNSTKDITLPFASPFNAGTWSSEVSNLVYDPGANSSQRWKLFWHHYLLVGGDRQFASGWVAYKAASSPLDLDSATELKLFGSKDYDANNDDVNWPTLPPVGGAPKINLSNLNVNLNSCSVFSEPALVATSNKLYFSAMCGSAAPADNRIFLLSCNSPCDVTNSANWHFVSVLLDNSIAASLGYEKFSAPELFVNKDGDYVLSVAPVSNSPFADAYGGCLFFKFVNLAAGVLQTKKSLPQIISKFSGTKNSHNGMCTYDKASTNGGFIYGEVDQNIDDLFQLFLTHKSI